MSMVGQPKTRVDHVGAEPPAVDGGDSRNADGRDSTLSVEVRIAVPLTTGCCRGVVEGKTRRRRLLSSLLGLLVFGRKTR